jgi:enhancing lycopene biosynthesis protein 2
MAMRQEVNVPLILTIGAVSVILLVVIVIGTDAWYLATNREINAENFRQYPDMTSETVQDSQRSVLTTPAHWLDEKHTAAAIPIDEAMKIVVERHGDVTFAEPATQPAPVK